MRLICMQPGYYSYDPTASLSRHIVVVGMTGTRAVAATSLLSQRTGLPFTEILRKAEHEHGKSIAPLTRQLGPGGIARAERSALRGALREQPHLIAGGDALLMTWANRRMAKAAFSVYFDAPIELIRSRIQQSPELHRDVTRHVYKDLVSGSRLEALQASFRRQSKYCDIVLPATGGIVDQVDIFKAALERAGVLTNNA